MTKLPRLLEEGRTRGMTLITLCCIGQGAGLMLSAFATRDIFMVLHSGNGLGVEALLMLAIAATLLALCEANGNVRAEEVGQSYARSLRMRLYHHISGMSQFDISKRRLGALSLRFVGDMSAARAWAGQGLARMAAALIILPTAVLTLYLLNPLLAIAGSVPVLLALVGSVAFASALPGSHKSLRSRRAGIAISMIERIAIATRLDLLGRTPRELQALKKKSNNVVDDAVDRTGLVSMLYVLPQLGAGFGGIAIFITAAGFQMPASDAAAATAVLAITMLPLRDLAGVWDRYCAWRIAKGKLCELLATESIERQFQARNHAVSVKLDAVWVAGVYADIELQAGSLVHLVGAAGSGKSSLLAAITAQCRPNTGRITFSEREAVPKIAYVGDKLSILKGSLRRSLTLGCKSRPPDDKVLEVARDFGLIHLVNRIGGLGGRIEELGGSVSSGEALRIEIVRSILSEPDLIIIDSSSLLADNEANTLVEMIYSSCQSTLIVAGGRARDFPSAQVICIEDGILKPASSFDDNDCRDAEPECSSASNRSESLARRLNACSAIQPNAGRPRLLQKTKPVLRLAASGAGGSK